MGHTRCGEIVGISDSTAQPQPTGTGTMGIRLLQCLLAALLPPFGAAPRFALSRMGERGVGAPPSPSLVVDPP